jgi:hypothetical protein
MGAMPRKSNKTPPKAQRSEDGSFYILLPSGQKLVFDEEFVPLAESRFWRASGPDTKYAAYNLREAGKQHSVFFHRVVAEAPKGTWVNFIDGDTLNCRRSNLRLVKPADVAYFSKKQRDLRRAQDAENPRQPRTDGG